MYIGTKCTFVSRDKMSGVPLMYIFQENLSRTNGGGTYFIEEGKTSPTVLVSLCL